MVGPLPDLKFFRNRLAELSAQGLLRVIASSESPVGLHVDIGGKRYLNICSNDYLGFANHPVLKEAAREALGKYGTGSGGSRLLGGAMDIHAELEAEVARRMPLGKALLFNSGFAANLGILQSLGPLFSRILADKLNHASLVDGMRQAGTPFSRYRHGDMNMLESLLQKAPDASNCLVCTETLFSMDGDFAPLEELLGLQKKYGFFLVLDEAHSAGCYPSLLDGFVRGCPDRMLIMGTFGKAYGGYGAYVVGPEPIVDYLINTARPFIFSTALPPSVAGAALAALRLAEAEPRHAQTLRVLSLHAARAMQSLGLSEGISLSNPSHILPIITRSNERALALSEALLSQGIRALPVRHPTVPSGTARIRFNLRSDMPRNELDNCLKTIAEAFFSLPPDSSAI